jgi:AcrR family transcriptional regulator
MPTRAAKSEPGTRERILEAALACFVEAGYEQTTIARICERAGVSNGTLFHRFATKEAVAEGLYLESIGDFQEGLWHLLAGRPRSLRRVVRGTIAHQIDWIEGNVERARFVYSRGTLEGNSPGSARLAEMNRKLALAYQEWLTPLIESGAVRPISMVVLNAVMTGPTHALARAWLAGRIASPLHHYLDELADAACASLSAGPATRARRTSAPVPARGHLRLELVSEKGGVIGVGEATAEIQLIAAPSPPGGHP